MGTDCVNGSALPLRDPRQAAPPRADDSPAAYHGLAFAWSPDAIVVERADGQMADANPAALALLGYTRAEFLRLHSTDLLPPPPSWTEERYAQFLRDGWWEGEVEVQARHGPLLVGVRVVVLPAEQGGYRLSYLRDLSDRRREEATRARLAALVASSADAIIGEALDGVITDWNPAAERLYGYTAAEAIGQPFAMLVPPESAEEIARITASVQRGESVADLETVRFTRDGRRIDISLTIFPVWNDARQIIATSAIVRDITGRKAAEMALAASEQRFRVAFQDAPIGMVLTAPDRAVLQVNRAICRLLGYSEAELLARPLRKLTHPDDIPANHLLVERTLAGEIDAFELEKRYIHQDGRTVWVLLCVSLVRDPSGTPRYFISQIQDITERKAAAAELAATHQRVQDVLERITDNFYALDRDGRLTYVNEATARLAQRPREALLGRDLWDLSSEEARKVLSPVFARAMETGEPQAIEFQHVPDQLWYDVRVYPSQDGLSVFFQDVTGRARLQLEMQRALAAAQSATRTQSLFVDMMSHELRTPLQAILGNAHFLLATAAPSLTAEQREDILAIQLGGERIDALIDQVLDLSRLEAGVLPLGTERVVLPRILEQVERDIAPQAAAKDLALRVTVAPDLPRVLGDPMRIRQILLHLAGNAVKFTRQGSVEIVASAVAGGVDVIITDTGIGIAPEALDYIFDPFRQADSGTLRRHEGAGLGLALARRLVEQMGGRLRVVSEPDAGSTFTLHLPAAPTGHA